MSNEFIPEKNSDPHYMQNRFYVMLGHFMHQRHGITESDCRTAAQDYIEVVKQRCKEKGLKFPSKLKVASLMRG